LPAELSRHLINSSTIYPYKSIYWYTRCMGSFSFDIVSDYDKAEMNNVFGQVEREIANRFDFKGTPAAIEWLENKSGFKIIGAGEWQIENILDIVRKKLA